MDRCVIQTFAMSLLPHKFCFVFLGLMVISVYVPRTNANAYKVIDIGCTEHITPQDETDGRPRGECLCRSLDDSLANLTNNTVINITSNVTLSSIFTGNYLVNISLVGHHKPTIRCSENSGALQLMYCYNCTVENIIWDGCGVKNVSHSRPVIQFRSFSNIAIQNCSFQNSVGRALVFIEKEDPGVVHINHCKFVNNSAYGNHGAAIYYYYNYYNSSLSSRLKQQVINDVFTIDNCNFTQNKDASSVVHINQPWMYLSLNNSIFYKNQGTPIVVTDVELNICGAVIIEENTAENAAGILVNPNSAVRFYKNSTVLFINNVASSKGGAIYMRHHATLLFDQGSRVVFQNNRASKG